MAKRHKADYTVKGYMKMILNNDVTFDSPVQRPADQWNNDQKTLLIHSILMDYDVPSVYAVEDKTKESMTYSIIDGKQRLNTLFEFVSDQFTLNKNTPTVRVDGREYDLSLYNYSELPENLQDVINDYQLNMIYFIDITEEEIFEMFYRLNNGKPLSTQQKAKSRMDMSAISFINQISDNEFVKNKLKLNDNQRRNGDSEVILELAMMLIDEEYTSGKYNAKDASKYMETLNTKSEEFLTKIKSTLDYLNEVYRGWDSGFELKKVNAPMLIAVASEAVDTIKPEEFYLWTQELSTYVDDKESDYAQFADKSTSNKGKVEGRLRIMKEHFNNHFNTVSASAN